MCIFRLSRIISPGGHKDASALDSKFSQTSWLYGPRKGKTVDMLDLKNQSLALLVKNSSKRFNYKGHEVVMENGLKETKS
jgi:hypothetical protein